MGTALISDLRRRMEATFESLQRDFSGLRTGRASVNLLDPVMVDAYGSQMPISQVGTVGIPEPRTISVQVWDAGLVKAVEKAIRDSDLGLNPSVDGGIVRIPLPDLSEERRRELVKVAKTYAEKARVAVRNVRRDGMEGLKKMEKESNISEDEHHRFSDDIQKLTDESIKKIDGLLDTKEQDILKV